MQHRYTNINSDLKRVECTSIRWKRRGNKQYITTVGGRPDDVMWVLKKIANIKDVYMTSGGWPTKNFTFRLVSK
jgi:hypothetical protein